VAPLAIAIVATGLMVEGTVRTEARGGTTVSGQDPSAVGAAADIRSAVDGADASLHLGVAPVVVAAQKSEVLGRVFAEGELRLAPSLHARLRQGLGYGTLDMSPVAGQLFGTEWTGVLGPRPIIPGAPAQPPSGTRFVEFEESATSLTVEMAPSRSLHISTLAAWTVSGGAASGARSVLPLAREARGIARAEWTATRLDVIRLAADGAHTTYSNGLRSRVARATAGASHRLSRTDECWLDAGAAVGSAIAPGSPSTVSLFPAGSAGCTFAPARDVSGSLSAIVEPLGDTLSGALVNRGGVRASLNVMLSGRASAVASFSGSTALTSATVNLPTAPRAGDTYLNAELGGSLQTGPRTTVSAGVRGAWFSRPVGGQPPELWAAFAAFSVRFAEAER
jgi:hypothetical protein